MQQVEGNFPFSWHPRKPVHVILQDFLNPSEQVFRGLGAAVLVALCLRGPLAATHNPLRMEACRFILTQLVPQCLRISDVSVKPPDQCKIRQMPNHDAGMHIS